MLKKVVSGGQFGEHLSVIMAICLQWLHKQVDRMLRKHFTITWLMVSLLVWLFVCHHTYNVTAFLSRWHTRPWNTLAVDWFNFIVSRKGIPFILKTLNHFKPWKVVSARFCCFFFVFVSNPSLRAETN